jgi:enamine deaminase RidA (YjgF/YER057c/UK114 family)
VSRKQVVAVPDGAPAFRFLSPAVRAGDLVYVSGHVGLVPGVEPSGEGASWVPGELASGGIRAETRQTLENVKRTLQAAGATLADVVKVNAFLRDVDRDFHAYNEVYLEYFPAEPPARTTVGAKMYGPILVEIECVAYAPVQGR